MKIKINYNNDDLWCLYSKERIEIGEKYAIVEEDCLGDIIEKVYKIEYCPIENNEDDDLYIAGDE